MKRIIKTMLPFIISALESQSEYLTKEDLFLKTIDIEKEYNLIKQKKSKYSKSQRELIVAHYHKFKEKLNDKPKR